MRFFAAQLGTALACVDQALSSIDSVVNAN